MIIRNNVAVAGDDHSRAPCLRLRQRHVFIAFGCSKVRTKETEKIFRHAAHARGLALCLNGDRDHGWRYGSGYIHKLIVEHLHCRRGHGRGRSGSELHVRSKQLLNSIR